MQPSGRLSDVYLDPAGRQGAYDFVESPHISWCALLKSAQTACARRATEYPFVFVPVDDTSLTLVDPERTKDFGFVGNKRYDRRGMKVIDALAVSPKGTPLGLAALYWWARTSPREKAPGSRKVKDKETVHWLETVKDVATCFASEAPNTRLWFQVDRGGDGAHLLRQLSSTGQLFTVRSNADRRLHSDQRVFLRAYVARQRPIGHFSVDVPGTNRRTARTARLAVRACTVVLRLQDKWTKQRWAFSVGVVHAHEVSRVPRKEKALDWMLLTNHSVATLKDARLVLFGYTQRWRIEDFHRTWKSAGCDVETTQLRKQRHVLVWATLLAAVAARVERLKHLSREQPELPASVELSPTEIEALMLLKRRYKKRTESIPKTMPSIAQATLWIAELGGYTGKSSGGPPGSITISRGLQFLKPAAALLDVLAPRQKSRNVR